MDVKHLFGTAGVLLFVGAILTFALHNPDASVLGLDLRSVGEVLLFVSVPLAGVAIILSGGLMKVGGKNASNHLHPGKADLDIDQLRTVTGLVVVVAAIIAVGVLTVVTAHILQGETKSKEAIIAITTSAFGLVSTVVTAFLGIRATANSSDKANKALAVALEKQDGSDDNPPDPRGKKPPDPPQGAGEG